LVSWLASFLVCNRRPGRLVDVVSSMLGRVRVGVARLGQVSLVDGVMGRGMLPWGHGVRAVGGQVRFRSVNAGVGGRFGASAAGMGVPKSCLVGSAGMRNGVRLAGSRAGKSYMGTSAGQSIILSADRGVGYWLLGVSGAVFGMVVLGGVTRLTRSGLSMVEWKPQGSMFPQTEQGWIEEFEKYKQYPEYKKMNMDMSLEEFKKIYLMEWGHRMWGRGLGLVFGLPFLYFLAKGRIQALPGMTPKLFGLLAMGGGQGLVGWWMVKSGLDEPEDQYKEPRVSAYRLTAHLVMALALYSGLVWTGLSALHPNAYNLSQFPASIAKLRRGGIFATVLAGVTFVSGAFVAGNDAGRAYNDWPLYAGELIPLEIWDEKLQPTWRNFFENTATVQFDHRNLAYTTFFYTVGLFAVSRRAPNWKVLTPSSQHAYYAILAAVTGQVLLGISTLMMFVPVELGALHQAGALTLWTTLLYSQHTLRFIRICH